jgi:hypothetical protein
VAYSSTLKMEAAVSSEMVVSVCITSYHLILFTVFSEYFSVLVLLILSGIPVSVYRLGYCLDDRVIRVRFPSRVRVFCPERPRNLLSKACSGALSSGLKCPRLEATIYRSLLSRLKTFFVILRGAVPN